VLQRVSVESSGVRYCPKEIRMASEGILSGKKILVVDDEEDVLETIKEQLSACDVTTANNFETAKEYLEKETFDLAILDIMGVRGFDLLLYAKKNKIRAIMLTAHAMNAESVQKSADKGAVSFLPKDEIYKLEELIAEIFGEMSKGRAHWPKLEERMGARFKKEWGKMWERIKFPRDLDID
jgi:DNA-binding response OmpR family regulator